jgi:predicted RNase H-like HicB family nuclease
MRYAVVIEQGESHYSAYVPDRRAVWPSGTR